MLPFTVFSVRSPASLYEKESAVPSFCMEASCRPPCQLMADIGASDAFYFHYSSGGELIGYTYKTAEAETECILVKNQQGDVERVISADGTILAAYTYDAWGNVLTSEGTLAASNPIRYRGYYYDTETSLYYLQSRYYDPAVGRFVNADRYAATGQGIHSSNMFAYCENNPVNRLDKTGNDWISAIVIVLVVAACAVMFDKCSKSVDNTPYSGQANCYAYAMKFEVDPRSGEPFESMLQPGELSGNPLSRWDLKGTRSQVKKNINSKVQADLQMEGYCYTEVGSADYTVRQGNWLIALAYSSNEKAFHWYRRGDDGTWSHKPGNTPIISWDESGNTITDPATCNRGIYDAFLGYYEVGPN